MSARCESSPKSSRKVKKKGEELKGWTSVRVSAHHASALIDNRYLRIGIDKFPRPQCGEILVLVRWIKRL
jgi:hypothetical protein